MITKSTQQEIIYITLLAAFIGVFFGEMYFFQLEDKISALNPVLQFLLVNASVYLIVFLGLKAVVLNKKIGTILEASLGGIIAFISIDMLLPEYHVTFAGQLLQGGIFGKGSSDYVFGYLYSLLGFHGPVLWFLVYIVTIIAGLALGGALMKNLVKEL